MPGYEGVEMMTECELIRSHFLRSLHSRTRLTFNNVSLDECRRGNEMVSSSGDHAFSGELHACWFVLLLASSFRFGRRVLSRLSLELISSLSLLLFFRDLSVDVWSVGCILAELLGSTPIFKVRFPLPLSQRSVRRVSNPSSLTSSSPDSNRTPGFRRSNPTRQNSRRPRNSLPRLNPTNLFSSCTSHTPCLLPFILLPNPTRSQLTVPPPSPSPPPSVNPRPSTTSSPSLTAPKSRSTTCTDTRASRVWICWGGCWFLIRARG